MPKSKPKILIVEDDDFLRKMYATGLGNHGFETISASDGEEALEALNDGKPDLCLLDLVMPKVDGYEVLSAMKDDDDLKDIPVVVLSGLGQEEDINTALQQGAEDYFIKTEHTVKGVAEKLKKILAKK